MLYVLLYAAEVWRFEMTQQWLNNGMCNTVYCMIYKNLKSIYFAVETDRPLSSFFWPASLLRHACCSMTIMCPSICFLSRKGKCTQRKIFPNEPRSPLGLIAHFITGCWQRHNRLFPGKRTSTDREYTGLHLWTRSLTVW